MQMVDDNIGNKVRQNAVQNDGNEYGNGNVVTAPAKGNGNGINGNPIRCYNCRGEGHYASNCHRNHVNGCAYLSNSYQIAQEDDARSNSHSRGMNSVAQCSVYAHDGSIMVNKDGKFTANHDVCVLNYVNNMNSRADNQSANVTIRENQKKYKENAKNSKELGSKGSLASSRLAKPSNCLRWIPTGRIFAMCGKLTASSNTENKSEKSMYDNASTSNPSEPSSKGFPISTSLLGRFPTGKQLLVHDESRFKTSCSIDKDKYTMKA
ncbi:gag-pol polyprotein [Tanacetum coccineum]|uniref:Gag-pol polyprotein n=1 Tax=Tanacetum coccineum TaxID=301880 RepID=A0ABQ5EZM5_9ASTR